MQTNVQGGPTENYSGNWSILYVVLLVWHLSNSIWNTSISGVKYSWTSVLRDNRIIVNLHAGFDLFLVAEQAKVSAKPDQLCQRPSWSFGEGWDRKSAGMTMDPSLLTWGSRNPWLTKCLTVPERSPVTRCCQVWQGVTRSLMRILPLLSAAITIDEWPGAWSDDLAPAGGLGVPWRHLPKVRLS